jgi:hypothetical protein
VRAAIDDTRYEWMRTTAFLSACEYLHIQTWLLEADVATGHLTMIISIYVAHKLEISTYFISCWSWCWKVPTFQNKQQCCPLCLYYTPTKYSNATQGAIHCRDRVHLFWLQKYLVNEPLYITNTKGHNIHQDLYMFVSSFARVLSSMAERNWTCSK